MFTGSRAAQPRPARRGRGVRAALGIAAVLLTALPAAATPAAAGVEQPAAGEITNNITLELQPDGTLQAHEELRFGGEVPAEFTRSFVLRQHYDNQYDRLFEVTRVRAESGERPLDVEVVEDKDAADVVIATGAAQRDDGRATVTLSYRVRGTTSSIGEATEMAWYAVGGYSEPVEDTRVVVDAAVSPMALSCAAGDPRSSIYCTSSDMGGTEALVARFSQARMTPGQLLRVVVSYPEASAEEQLILDRRFSFTSAFKITGPTLLAFSAVVLVLVGGLSGLIYARGRDERAMRRELARGMTSPVVTSSGGAVFRPPDGVNPGQIGTLIDEQADVVDVTATVVDLAVRGFLVIEELPRDRFAAADWALHRRPHPDGESLRAYESLLLQALFTDRDTVRLSELGDELASVLPDIRAQLYLEMVRLRWFSGRPNIVRNRWTTAGISTTVAGLLLTVILAMSTDWAFTALAVIIAGAAITVGAQYMPTKTARGSEVLAHTLGFRAYLGEAEPPEVPREQRVDLFSRYLPYAIIFDKVDKWAGILAEAGSQDLEYDDLPWYHAPEEWRLADFTDSIKTFTRTLSGIISNTRPLRLTGTGS